MIMKAPASHAERRPTLIELTVEAAKVPEPPQAAPPEPVIAAAEPHAVAPARRRLRPSAPEPVPTPPPEQPTAADEPREQASGSAPAGEAAPGAPGDAVAVAPAVPSAPSGATAAPLDLSPRRAAASMVTQLDTAPRACRPRGGAASTSSIPLCEPEDDSTERTAQARLNQSLQASARALSHLAKREPPQLRPQADGSLRYDGSVFRASIGSDGQVKFDDRSTQTGFSDHGFGASFDLNDAMQGTTGDERYSAEKRWFLEQTAQVRDELAVRARAAEHARARKLLEDALARILADALPPAQKRAKVFALWEDCGEDADAIATQRLVEAFVRRSLPRDSELGYSDDELRRLNEGRAGARRFDPYRPS
jgi:hypothetical protein